MTVDDLKNHHGFKEDQQVAEEYEVTKTAVSKWRKTGIPINRQALIQLKLNGALKADLQTQPANDSSFQQDLA